MKIFIECPAKAESGGPELLHQLCCELNEIGFNAKMYYFFGNKIPLSENPTPTAYLKYKTTYVTSYEPYDSSNSVLIVPETGIEFLEPCKLGKKIIWWLSVDNYIKKYEKILQKDSLSPIPDPLHIHDLNAMHLTQSYYAYEFIQERFGIAESNIQVLSDYLNSTFASTNNLMRANFVLYNPMKGYEFTLELIKSSPDISWLALSNLSPQELAQLLQLSKIYVDFGEHPGKDRIPREAALSGCCILTSKVGSARNNFDLPIPDNYKFDHPETRKDEILSLIREILGDFSEHTKNFLPYRQKIQREKEIFHAEVSKIFNEIADELSNAPLNPSNKWISIIVLCQNNAPTLRQCIDALVHQTIGIERLELIFIDEASTDDTYSILLEYEAKYSDSILVIHCDCSQSQETDRALGAQYASSGYISFLDGNDWVNLSVYEELYKNMESSTTDIVKNDSFFTANEFPLFLQVRR